MIKFNKYNVVNTETKQKARIFYSLDNRIDGRKCVTLYAKDWGNSLSRVFESEYVNNTNIREDYFEKGKVVLFEDHSLYSIARQKAESISG